MTSEFCIEWLGGQEELVGSHRIIMFAVCMSNLFFAVVATTGNLLAIHGLWKASSIPANIKTFFLNLAFSDLAVGLFAQLMFGIIIAVMLRMTANGRSSVEFLCPASLTVSYYLSFFLSCASFLNICSIAVDRLLAVSLHLRYQELVTSKRVIVALASLWLTSCVTGLIFISFPDHSRKVIVITEIVGLLLTAMAYVRIFKVVRYHQHQIQSQLQIQNAQVLELLREQKSAINAFIVYAIFLVCFLPLLCTEALFLIKGSRTAFYVAEDVSLLLVFLNSSMNPLVYCWRYREIREIAMGVIKKLFRINH